MATGSAHPSSLSLAARGPQTPPPSGRANSRPGSSASNMDMEGSGKDSPDADYHPDAMPDASEESPEDDYDGYFD